LRARLRARPRRFWGEVRENPRGPELGRMTKKKEKGKTAAKKTGKTKKKSAETRPRVKKHANPGEVRNDIAKIVESGAKKIAQAVMSQALTGQLAPAKFLFEVAKIYPEVADGSQATAEEDCLAKTLLHRLNLPEEPIGRDEEGESESAGKAAGVIEKDGGGEREGDEESKDPVLN
jgi:hypothetical protein